VLAEVGAFGEVLAQQAVGVLVRAALHLSRVEASRNPEAVQTDASGRGCPSATIRIRCGWHADGTRAVSLNALPPGDRC